MNRFFASIFIVVALIALSPSAANSTPQQDPTFRLMNIERRLDQLQMRVDFIERAAQNQSSQSATGSSFANQAVLEMQRQQLSMAEQLINLQKQMLEMQKTIDRLNDRAPERSPKPRDEAKPKPNASKP